MILLQAPVTSVSGGACDATYTVNTTADTASNNTTLNNSFHNTINSQQHQQQQQPLQQQSSDTESNHSEVSDHYSVLRMGTLTVPPVRQSRQSVKHVALQCACCCAALQ